MAYFVKVSRTLVETFVVEAPDPITAINKTKATLEDVEDLGFETQFIPPLSVWRAHSPTNVKRIDHP